MIPSSHSTAVRIGATRDESRPIPAYASIDSAPPGYAVIRSPWVAPVFLLSFTVISAALLLGLPTVRSAYLFLLSHLPGATPTESVALGLRPFFVAFFVAFGAFAAGPVGRRVRFILVLCASYLLPVLLVDGALLRLREVGIAGPFSLFGDIVTGIMGVLVLGIVVLAQCHLPAGDRIDTNRRRSLRYGMLFAGSLLASAVISLVVIHHAGALLDNLWDLPLFGGIGLGLGPGIAIFRVLFTLLLVGVAMISLRNASHESDPCAVAFLVPAFNEAEGIAQCIRSLDRAAANYAGPCRLYLVDNGSRDGTSEIAAAELAQCRALTGDVLVCLQPGKARALNYGLARIAEEIVIRVDADTLVSDSILPATVSYFADPIVGGVGGMPAPKNPSSLLAHLRAIEVHETIGLQRVSQHGVDAVTCVPGYYAACRRQCIIEAGGYVEGMNGEDADLTVRIGRLGYRLVADPRLRMYSEVPGTWRHLREQRLRWYRSAFHVLSRNKSAIWLRQGLRGLWALPEMLVQGTRRLIMLPLVIYAGLVFVIAPWELALRGGAVLVAVIVGIQSVTTVVVLLAYRRVDLIPFLPAYLVFRVIRWYISLEMLFTLPLKAKSSRPVR